jgi:hypothetical protein
MAMLCVGSIVLRVDDLRRQAAFWMAALDYAPRDDLSGDFVLLRSRNGTGPNLSLDAHHSTLQVPLGSIWISTPTTRRQR